MAGRLDVLNAAEAGLADRDVLLLALQHSVAALGGLGGMAHLRGPGLDTRLRLVATSGLPRPLSEDWDSVPGGGETAPARAAREGEPVWLPSTVTFPGAPVGIGMVAVPLPAPEGPLGSLSVMVPDATGEPDAAGMAVVGEVAGWAAGRLGRRFFAGEAVAISRAEPSSTPGIRQTLKAVRAGAWEWDIRRGQVSWSESMLELLGMRPDAFGGRVEAWTSLIHPDDLRSVIAETQRALRTRSEGEFEYRMRRRDGSWAWLRTRGRVITDEDGTPTRMIGTVWDDTHVHSTLEAVGRALKHMSDGFLTVGRDGRVTFVNVQAEQLLGLDSQSLTGRSLWELPVVRRVPGLRARCRQAVDEGTAGEFEAPWPDEDRWYRLRLVPAPDGLTIYLTDVTDRRLREAERAGAERTAAERAARIRALTAALSKAVSSADVVSAVADHIMLPFDASAMVVWVVEDERLRVVDAIGYSSGFLKLIDRLPTVVTSPITDSFRSQSPQFIASPEEYLARYPGTEELVARSEKRSWAFLPLIVSGRGVGACVISFDSPRHLTDEERTLLTAISGLFGQALGRALLYDVEHGRAKELQRGLLPRVLPRLPAVTAAARYQPAGQGIDVGGDWYDIIPLSSDRVALVIGDVMGHGISEAATMGRLRTAVHTLADLELPPDEVLGHLNEIVSDLGDDFYATCLYAVYDPASRRCVFARAGHPPPAIVYPDGGVRFPALDPNAPLGAASPPFDTEELELPNGSLLVLYTDGLVESADRDIDQGMTHLATALTTFCRDGWEESPEALCEAITGALLPPDQRTGDDAALLVARTHWLAPDNVASWPLPEDPIAAGQARDHVREQLALWHLDELTTATELVASELVGNVIRHAKGPIRLRLMRSRSLICEVSDGSHTTPHIRRASETDEGGRGLQLIAALSQRWGTRFTPDGKSIWTEQTLPEDPR